MWRYFASSMRISGQMSVPSMGCSGSFPPVRRVMVGSRSNYAKTLDGLFKRLCAKISAVAVLQYTNFQQQKY